MAPRYPWRYRAFLYACALLAAEQQANEVKAMAMGGATRAFTR